MFLYVEVFIKPLFLSSLPGLTPVHVATKEASIEVLKYLFQIGANKNASVRRLTADRVPLSGHWRCSACY